MGNETKSLLFDVIAGCKHIEEFTVSINFDDYEKSSLIRSAVERQFMIVGEAINKLKVVDADIFKGIPHASQIVGFRNILVHGYNAVSNQLVWEIIRDHIGELKKVCESFLDK